MFYMAGADIGRIGMAVAYIALEDHGTSAVTAAHDILKWRRRELVSRLFQCVRPVFLKKKFQHDLHPLKIFPGD